MNQLDSLPPQAAATVDNPFFKTGSAWVMVGISSWGDVASILAAIYTACLISEWFWKRMARPFAERRGWINRKARRHTDAT